MRRPNTTRVDRELCTGCGLCVSVCPSMCLSMKDGIAQLTGESSIQCDHCAAVCPAGAITVAGVDDDALELATVENLEKWLGYGDYDTAGLVQLMRSRRSCRRFSEEAIDREVLTDLVKIGITAPSGTNAQLWTFTIVPHREAVEKVAARIAAFFRRLNRMARKRAARLFSKLFMKDALGEYYREYHHSVEEGLSQWDREGRDRLFHHAAALIIIGMKPGSSCPCEDALMASQNILLAAHAMGLGTCMIGFAVEAMRHDPSIKRMIGIPESETVYAVIAVGKAREKYQRLCRRKKVAPRFYEG